MASEQEWIQKIKKRREQQWKQIKKRGQWKQSEGNKWMIAADEPQEGNLFWSPSSLPSHKQKKRQVSDKILKQWFVVVLLFLGTAVVYSTPAHTVSPLKNWISQALTKEFRFSAIEDWYHQYLAGSPALLPAFSGDFKKEKTNEWVAPVSGKIALPFDEKRKGVVLITSQSASVAASEEGWVQFTGYKEGLGNTIIIQHANGMETWYGWLEDLKVKEKAWVKKGQKIGNVKKMDNQSFFYFALRKNKEFINPASVISFD